MKKLKKFESFKLNETTDDIYNVWKTLSSICNGTNKNGKSYLSDAWDENGNITDDFKEKLIELKHYLNFLKL